MTSAKNLSIFVFLIACIVFVSCKKKKYNYQCWTAVSHVNAVDDYSYIRTDTTYLEDATTKEANTYERENSIRGLNAGEEAKSTVCHIMLP